MFIPLAALSQVKQPCRLPAISFCLANVTKRHFFAGMHLLPDQLPRTEAQSENNLIDWDAASFYHEMMHYHRQLLWDLSTVYDACSL